MTNDPPAPQDPAFLPTARYDESAINRARNLLDAMPETIGPYRVLERLGGGGMGEVYRAEQRAPIRRDVALKFIKLGMDTKLVIARFEAERQALALMDHPHIAKVFDAGTDDTGRPYFVMEYVKGKPITEYADQNHLSISERLELFEQVCQAVQHAHHKGVIHRDLKPGNVLVSTQDGKPFAKVIDFGIAKAIAQRLTDHTLFTEHAQFVGTPQYMSPEQAEGSVDIDTRTDVYSLGVMLYELLTGSTPFSSQELKAAAFEQIKKMIVEVDPPKPSTRLSLSQPTLSTLAASRRTEPKRLGTLVRGELDWIVMKALDKDRKRRYETPTSLANDIEAHLKGEPVQAAPPSTAYRIRKFIRKHRGSVIGVATVGVALLLGIIGTSWGYILAERNAEREREAKDRERLARQEATEQRDAATTAREQAIDAKNAFEVAKNEAVAAQDQAEGALARGFVRPLVGDQRLTQVEIEPLWELATLESDSVGLRMLDEATRDPRMTAQLLECAEPALVAALGLNPDLRRRALTLLRPRLSDQALAPDHRAGIACLTLMILDQPGHDSAACLALIKECLAADAHTSARWYVFYRPGRVVPLLEPSIAVEILLAAFSNARNYGLSNCAEAVIALSARLEPEAVGRLTDSLVVALADPKRTDYDFSKLAKSAAALSSHLERKAAARVCELASARLLARLNDPKAMSNHLADLWISAYELAALSARLEPGAVPPVSDWLLAALTDPKRSEDDRDIIAGALVRTLSQRFEPGTAARVTDRLLAAVTDPAHIENDRGRLANALAGALDVFSQRLDREAAARVTDALLTAIVNPYRTDSDLQMDRLAHAFASSLGVSSARLERDAAARLADVLLAGVVDPNRNAVMCTSLNEALTALSAHLEPEAAARVTDGLLAALTDPKWANSFDMSSLESYTYSIVGTLAALCTRVEPKAAARVADGFLAALTDPKRPANRDDSVAFADALGKISARLAPDAAARAIDKLLAVLADPKRSDAELASLAKAAAALSSRLEPIAAARACEATSDRLLSSLGDSKRAHADPGSLAKAAAALLSHLEPPAATRICESATDSSLAALADPKLTEAQISSISIGIGLLGERLEPGRAKAAALRVIARLLDQTSDVRLETTAMVSRHLPAPVRQTILDHLLVVKLAEPWDFGMFYYLSGLPRQTLTAMQREEPHHAAMGTPVEAQRAANNVAMENLFSTVKLTTPEIVEFLKSPVMPGVVRRAFLDLLECRYGRRFGNQWAFVEYAQAENLGLDFTTRVKRPDPEAILKDIHKLLDEELAKP